MKKLRISITASVFVFFCMNTAFAQGTPQSLLQQAANGTLRPATIDVTSGSTIVTKTAPFFSGGLLAAARAAMNAGGKQTGSADADSVNEARPPDLGLSGSTVGCGEREGHRNTRVNQDCTFRQQAEESIVFNPADRSNLLAGMNNSRVGFNQCGIAFSTDNGQHWGDMQPPFRSKLNNPAREEPTPSDPNRHTIQGGPGTFHTYDAASDPGVAFDSQGRGFFSCIAFDINSNADMIFVTRSPLGAAGSFFFNISSFSRNVVTEDNSAAASLDKPFIRADTFTGSPNRDNVYATWTVFNFTCGPQGQSYCSSTIFGSMSTDHGVTWSTPEEISGTSPLLCFFGNAFDPTRSPNSCDFDQGSDPVVLPNGNVVVAFFNGNTPANNPNAQQLALVCHPTGSSPAGTAHMNCAPPVKVGDDIGVAAEPQCDFGRGPEECIPGAFIRANDFPRIAVNKANGHIYVAWQDYRNREFDIQLARSLDGGATWGPSATVNPDTGLDHYFAAIDIVDRADRDRVGISYFRTERVPNENTTPPAGFAPGQPGVKAGNSDYVLAGGTDSAVPYNFKVISPVFPPPDGIQTGFNGDYSGLTITRGEEAHPIWSDTRNADPFAPANGVMRDEDVFTDNVQVPSGVGSPGTGKIGKSNSGGEDQ